jgi:hypothetical protein
MRVTDRGSPLAFVILAIVMIAGPVSGQSSDSSPPWARRIESRVAPVPFGPGEYLEYNVKLGWFSVGGGYLAVVGMDTVRGHPTYHVMMGIEGGLPLARVEDRFESWIDVEDLKSHRFVQDVHEVRYQRFRQFEFFPGEMRFERADNDEAGELPTAEPLDDLSFVYYVRTLPLEVGETYTLDRYFKDTGNPVVIQVLRKERVEVPAGTFNTIVVRPIIKTRGLFSEGGEAEVYFSDDERRLVVRLESKVPVVGHFSLHLRSIEEGPSLRPWVPELATRPVDTAAEPRGNR